MNRILKLKGEPVLNFADIKKGFSPWLIFDKLQDFIYFAKVHCLPVSDIIRPKGENQEPYTPEYITKKFWLDVLDFNEKTFEGPVKNYFKYLIYNLLGNNQSDEEQLNKEIDDLKIYHKIAHICYSGRLDNKDAYTVLILLAICELCETDASTVDFKNILSTDKEKTKDHILYLTPSEILPLPASDKPYTFAFHDSDKLQEGETIQTVRIEAISSANTYDNVHIRLYSEKQQKIISETVLKGGESVYCNVSGEKIIRFLPSVSISDDMCLVRTIDENVKVVSQDSDSWQLNAKGISCFSAGSHNEGFILIQNGHLNMEFFKGSLNESWGTQYFILKNRKIVEAKKTDKGIIILTDTGRVYTDDPYEKGLTQNTVSLDNSSRDKMPEIACAKTVREVALSRTNQSLCVRLRNEEDIILFNENGKKFKLKENGEIIDKITIFTEESNEL